MKTLEKNWLEWLVFAISFILVIGTLGYLVYDAATSKAAPPRIDVQLGTAQPQSNYFVVPVAIINHGNETAEGVQIEVVLTSGGKEQESANFEVAFLPRRSNRDGWVTFQTDPRLVEMEARVLGYEKP